MKTVRRTRHSSDVFPVNAGYNIVGTPSLDHPFRLAQGLLITMLSSFVQEELSIADRSLQLRVSFWSQKHSDDYSMYGRRGNDRESV